MRPVVASVPFVNARPLVCGLDGPDSPVELRFDLPSLLPALLDAGSASAVLASSIEALRTSGRRYVAGLCIGSDGPAESVRLFSRTHPRDIRSIALDRSSLTSNSLAKIILRERYACDPDGSPQEPDLQAMLKNHDAALLIGDRGMLADGDGLHVLDLGAEWTAMTGLPFVWALWMGGSELTPHVAGCLTEAYERWVRNQSSELDQAEREVDWPAGWCRRYLAQTMKYRLDERAMAGLLEFRALLREHRLIPDVPMPVAVQGSPALGRRI